MNRVEHGPFFPGVIAQVGDDWHVAMWPGQPERTFATYDAAARWLTQQIQEVT